MDTQGTAQQVGDVEFLTFRATGWSFPVRLSNEYTIPREGASVAIHHNTATKFQPSRMLNDFFSSGSLQHIGTVARMELTDSVMTSSTIYDAEPSKAR